jgi:hypothetical protein
MSFMDTHGAYQEHKEDPLVVLLLKYLTEKATALNIPEVWKSFIKQSTSTTDLNLLLSQLPVWGLTLEIDPTLRGEELLSTIVDYQYVPLFNRADTLCNEGRPWPIALEEALIEKGLIPTPESRKMLNKAHIRMEGDVIYTETGIVTYRVHRRIPAVKLLIPPEWILENCNPDVGDNRVLRRLSEGMNNSFAPFDVRSEGGFTFRAWCKKIFCYSPVTRFDTDKLRGALDPLFPKQISGSTLDDEQMVYVDLHSPVPDQLREAKDIDQRGTRIEFKQDRRGAPRLTEMRFPTFDTRTVQSAQGKSIILPEAHRIYSGRPQKAYSGVGNSLEKKKLVDSLRLAYTELTQASEYDKHRRAALA